jgi:predicted nucleotidyltransferase
MPSIKSYITFAGPEAAGIDLGWYIRAVTQFDLIFSALQATGVRYVVVGGVAVNLHGHQRFTKDIDLVIELAPDRALKALQALETIGFRPNVPVKVTDFANPVIREGWIRDKGMMVFQMSNDRTRMSVDIFVRYPLDFEELWSRGVKIDLPGTSLRIASIDHLIAMKRSANRPQDLLDIEQLERIRRLLDEKEGGTQ